MYFFFRSSSRRSKSVSIFCDRHKRIHGKNMNFSNAVSIFEILATRSAGKVSTCEWIRFSVLLHIHTSFTFSKSKVWWMCLHRPRTYRTKYECILTFPWPGLSTVLFTDLSLEWWVMLKQTCKTRENSVYSLSIRPGSKFRGSVGYAKRKT